MKIKKKKKKWKNAPNQIQNDTRKSLWWFKSKRRSQTGRGEKENRYTTLRISKNKSNLKKKKIKN